MFGELEDRMIEVLGSHQPNYTAAKELIRQGADINAYSEEFGENLLSELLTCLWPQETEGVDKPDIGAVMCEVIRFFLDHGFEVGGNKGSNGAQVLSSIGYPKYNGYVIRAAKMLLDAGTRDAVLTCGEYDGQTIKEYIASESAYNCMMGSLRLANDLTAVYQMLDAVEDGHDYSGIESFAAVAGKRIKRVLAEKPESGPVFYPLDLATFKKENCFNQMLWFVYDGGALITNEYVDGWVDSSMPDNKVLIDVSEHFRPILGRVVKNIRFDRRTVRKGIRCNDQPIMRIEMDNGITLKLSINFGEVKEEERAAFFELHGSGNC